MEVKELIQKLLGEVHKISSTETVVGEPLQVGKSKLIPISKLSIGFGVGGAESQAEGKSQTSGEGHGQLAGAGGGLKVEPVAFIAVDPEGRAQLLCLDEPEATVIDKLLQIAPELAERVLARTRQGATADPEVPESAVD